jgi:hypothetical protein
VHPVSAAWVERGAPPWAELGLAAGLPPRTAAALALLPEPAPAAALAQLGPRPADDPLALLVDLLAEQEGLPLPGPAPVAELRAGVAALDLRLRALGRDRVPALPAAERPPDDPPWAPGAPPGADRAALLRHLLDPAGQAVLQDALRRADAGAAAAGLPRLGAALAAAAQGARGALIFAGFAASVAAPPPHDPAADLRAALAWLRRPGRIALAAEAQAFGVAGSGPLRESRWMQAFVRLHLDEAGAPGQRPALRRIAEAAGAAPLRWYHGWAGIPPDADSLGVYLRVAARCLPRDDPRPATWLSALREAVPQGTPTPTWLCAPGEAAPPWGGPRCTAVLAACTRGLLAWDPAGLRPWICANIDELASVADVGAGAWHYPPDWARGWWARLCAEAAASGLPAPPPPPPGQAAAAAEAGAGAAEVAVLLSGELAGPAPLPARAIGPGGNTATNAAVRAAVRALARAQLPDGSWPASPVFIIPAKPPQPATRLLCATTTTAVVAHALALALRRGFA